MLTVVKDEDYILDFTKPAIRDKYLPAEYPTQELPRLKRYVESIFNSGLMEFARLGLLKREHDKWKILYLGGVQYVIGYPLGYERELSVKHIVLYLILLHEERYVFNATEDKIIRR
jgi:hypothetical protein